MNRTWIIAEAGVNHNGSLDMAIQLVDEAFVAGADAVKFQTFKADKVIAVNAPKAVYQIETTGPVESQLEMVRKLELMRRHTSSFTSIARTKVSSFCQPRSIWKVLCS